MRIFGWIHRKLQCNVDYCVVSCKKVEMKKVADEGKKVTTLKCERDTEALLRGQGHVALIDLLEEWQDGLLAIGTLGLTVNIPFVDRYPSTMDELESDTITVTRTKESDLAEPVKCEGKGKRKRKCKGNAVMGTGTGTGTGRVNESSGSEYELGLLAQYNEVAPKETELVENSKVGGGDIMATEEINNGEELGIGEIDNNSNNNTKNKKKKKGERTTLADLFSEEQRVLGFERVKIAMDSGNVDVKKNKEKKMDKGAKHVRKVVEKLVQWKKGEESRPTTKVHRMLTKMLKRKIHPEHDNRGCSNLDSNNQKGTTTATTAVFHQHDSTFNNGDIE